MGKDESELVPMNKEPGYGGTDEESKKPDIDISDFKPTAPTWVFDGSLRAKEQKKFEALIESASSKAVWVDARSGRVLLPIHAVLVRVW